MGGFKRFEDIVVWQRARELAREIYSITGQPGFRRDFPLIDQMRRASVSIMSNIAEGFERSGRREFIQFLSVSKGSSGELRSQLYIALDMGYLDQGTFRDLYDRTQDLARKIGALMRYLRDSEVRGAKYERVHQAR